MTFRAPLAWRQLLHERLRLMAATAGIAFAVILMLMQLGFQAALFTSASLHFDHMLADIALVSRQYEFVMNTKGFPERRLYQAYAVDGVESVAAVYCGQAAWKNPWTRRERTIYVFGFDPRPGFFDLGTIKDPTPILRLGDNILFDARSRAEFGPVAREFQAGHPVVSEISGHSVNVAGLFTIGTSFGIDGAAFMSDRNFFRVMAGHPKEIVNVGLIKLKPGYNADQVRARLANALPDDVMVLTHNGLVEFERNYWSTNTPIGFVFQLGLLMGMFVGAIIVYQILYTDVTDHIGEYATLKAMGYRNSFLFSVVIQESVILSVFGYIPGFLLSVLMYKVAGDATLLPIRMTLARAVVVYILTALMCVISGALAMRKLSTADPAEIF
jgi:putative ABC transport system permease protein